MQRKYKIIEGEKTIKACSNFRLPFEPNNVALSYRNDLRISISKLRLCTNQMLRSKYITNKIDFFDIENVLFYNIGTSSFRAISRNGIIINFEQRNIPINDCNHILEYQIIDASFLKQPKNNYLVYFTFNLPSLVTSNKAGDFWLAIHQGRIDIKQKNLILNDDFGLFIEIESNKDIYSIASIMKSLLDGIISGFHRENDIDYNVVNYLSDRYSITDKSIIAYLRNESYAVLGDRNLVSVFRNAIKWDPVDERCKEITIIPKLNKHIKGVNISGKLYGIDNQINFDKNHF